MNTTQYDSRTADKFVVRLPQGLRDQIDATAITDDRSMNSVIVQAVKQYLDAQNRQELLLNALASAGATGAKSMVVSKPQVDPRDLFVKLNPIGAEESELEMGRSGFVDDRTHADYLIFLDGYRVANPDQTERTPEDSSVVAQPMHIDDRVKMVVAEPAFLTVVFKLPSLSEAPPLIAQLPYGQKALGTEAVVFGLSKGNLMEGDV